MKDRHEALYKIIERIKQDEILLPDFQRSFVWTDPNRQCALIASVLAKLPIGDILLLTTKNPKEYACKILGSKKKIPEDQLKDGKEVSFLLDGQQRVTILTVVFSDTIFNFNKKVSDLVSDSLKRRFFIKFPQFGNFDLNDPFGLWDLKFTIDDPKNPEPSFVSSDMLPIVDFINFTVSSDEDRKNAYNPYNDDVMKLNSLTPYYQNQRFANCYAIPLFLLDNTSEHTMILDKMVKAIADSVLDCRKKLIKILLDLEETNNLISDNSTDTFMKRAKQFYDYAFNSEGKFDVAAFLKHEKLDSVFNTVLSRYDENADRNEIYNAYVNGLELKQSYWINAMKSYLTDCVDGLNLRQLILEETERRRAIDIFENMNKGGVKLDIFDLIMARVAIVTPIAFNERLKKFIKTGQDLVDNDRNSKTYFSYPRVLIPDKIKNSFDTIKDKYKASKRINCLDTHGIIVSKYKEAFLNVLSLIVYKDKYITNDFLNGDANAVGFKLEVIKEDKKLKMEPIDIFNCCKTACIAMDRAFYFFQVRCGIREVNEINYTLMIPLVAFILHEDKNYTGTNSEKVFNLLEAWYWASIFAGSYDRNQNVVMMSDLNTMIKNINDIDNHKSANLAWLRDRIVKILNATDFSDKEFMVLEKANISAVPKGVMKNFVCQYYLSNGYYDLIKPDNSTTPEFLNVFCSSSKELEMHHVIPLGTAADIKTSASQLRADPANYLNSPLNMLYISKNANRIISDESLANYTKNLPVESDLTLVGFTKTDLDYQNPNDIKSGPLKKRHDLLRSAVTGEVNMLISNL